MLGRCRGAVPYVRYYVGNCVNGVVYADNDHDSQTADRLEFTDGSHLDLTKTMHKISLSNTILKGFMKY